jgi:chemotaxis signal transduction protein
MEEEEDFFWDGIEDDDFTTDQAKFLVVHVEKRSLAVPQENILSLIVCPEITPLPETPEWNPGVIKVRDNLYPIIDLRKKIGLPTHNSEVNGLIASLEEREAEHKQWLETLKQALEKDLEFTLPRDPHQCKFGQWYDSFSTENDLLALEISKFAKPHTDIHALADEAFALAKREGKESALKYIDLKSQSTMDKLVGLFERTKLLLKDSLKSIAILTTDEKPMGILVDRVESFIHLDVEAGDHRN